MPLSVIKILISDIISDIIERRSYFYFQVTKMSLYEVIGSIDRGKLILYPFVNDLFTPSQDELKNAFMFYGTFLLKFKNNNSRILFFNQFENILVPVDNISELEFIVSVFSKEKISKRIMLILPGSTPAINSWAEVLNPTQGMSWYHFGDSKGVARHEIFSLSDEFYNSEFVDKVYLLANSIPFKVIYVPQVIEVEEAYNNWQVHRKQPVKEVTLVEEQNKTE